MAKVDSKGRIVLPQDIRERLGITPGTTVEVREEDGRAVVEPEDDPNRILDRMEQLVETASSERGKTVVLEDSLDLIARKHRDAIQRGANADRDE